MKKVLVLILLFLMAIGLIGYLAPILKTGIVHYFSSRQYWLKNNIEEKTLDKVTNLEAASLNNSLNNDSNHSVFYFSPDILESDTFISVNLTAMILTIYQNNQPLKTYSIKHKGPEDKWFRTPTGYFKVLNKEKAHFSSKFPVYMPYSIRFYEDFYIHGIPYYPSGEKVPPRFTGGCLRLEDNDAQEVYAFSKIGMPVIIFDEVDCRLNDINNPFQLPIDCHKSWIRQNFNNPVKIESDYYQHTGVDFGAPPYEPVLAAGDGEVVYLEFLNKNDHGLGNTVILEHKIQKENQEEKIYTLYAHLNKINNLKLHQFVKKGEVLGEVGASGYGCNYYWRVGPNGCESSNLIDYHLHFEIKTSPVLNNPLGELKCKVRGQPHLCYGYTPKYPQNFGYLDPLKFIQEQKQ